MNSGAQALAVLLVEDDPADTHLLRAALGGIALAGHVGSLADAIAWLDTDDADIVLLDLGLPDSEGLPTLHRLLAAHPGAPVVVLSGRDDDDQAGAAVEAGAQEYVVKGSVDPQVMRRTLRHAAERHRLQVAARERAKEAACLHAIVRELQLDQGLDAIADAVARHVRSGMGWPGSCRVLVDIDGTTGTAGTGAAVGTDDGRERLVARIGHGADARGRLEVSYSDDRPFLLPHEQDMLDGAAEAIEMWLGRRDAVRSLTAEEERLRVLVTQLPGLVWSTDLELRTTSYDGALLRDLGIPPDALLGRPIVELFESDVATGSLDPFLGALRGESATFERHWRGRWWRNQVEPRRDETGAIAGVVCLTLDITEERARAEELAATRARLQGLFDNASDAMILCDDAGRYLEANPAACALAGRTHDELVGLHCSDLYDAPPETTRTMWETFLATGSVAGEFAIRRPDGRRVEVELRAVTDIVPGVHLSVMRDVTDRRRMEAALVASEERFRDMAEAAQDAIYRFHLCPTFAFDYLNAATETISGFPLEAFHDNPRLYLDRVHREDLALLDHRRLRSVERETVTVRFRHADGGWIWLEDSRAAVLDEDGVVIGVQGVVRDVTARKRTEQALAEALDAERRAIEQLRSSDRLKSHFLQAVSHELRTPLTAVLGLSETLLAAADRLDAAQAQVLQQRVVANARRLEHLLTDLLDLERLEHDAIRIDRVETDVAALVAATAEEVELGERELTLVTTGSGRAAVDPVRVGRIVHNLLTNAAKHTPPGTHVTLRCHSDEHATTIEVADDGPGVPDDLTVEIFEPFRQGPASYDAASPGTGIGLSIVRQFAALHGGTAWVDRTPGGGATFTVRLPHRPSPTPALRPSPRPTSVRPVLPGPRATAAPAAGATSPGPGPLTRQVAAVRAGTALGTAVGTAPTSTGTRVDAPAVVAWATRELLTATSRDEVVGVVLRAVHQLGGWTVPARVADEGLALPLDVSFGAGEPLLPAAHPTSVERMLLERHLPQLVADARAALDGILRRREVSGGRPAPPDVPHDAGLERMVARCRAADVLLVLELEADALDDAAREECVQALADCLKEQLRARDEAARLGPASFAALLRDSDRDGADALLTRLHARWDRRRPRTVGFSVRHVTCSDCAGPDCARPDCEA